MPPPNNDQIIEPAAAPLSKGRSHTPHRRRKTLIGQLAARGFLLVALASSAWFLFTYLSNRIDPVEMATMPTAPSSPTSSARDRGTATQSVTPIGPFEGLQLEKARTAAKQELSRFVELELRLEEEMNSGAWATEELVAIKDKANQADQLFITSDYEAALAEYGAAVSDFEALLQRGADIVASSVEAGGRALETRDAEAAAAAFGDALEIMPNHPPALAGSTRAARLPEIIELLREFDRAELREDYRAAQDHLLRIQTLDPLTTGLAERFARIERALSEIEYRDNLSRGFAALEAGSFDAADAAFESVLAEHPTDAVALSGQQQTQRARTLARIDQLHKTAREHEHGENWEEALATYDEVLAIDPSIKFARDGKVRAHRQSSLIQSMERVLGDPAALSSDDELAKARVLLADAQAETVISESFTKRRDRLRQLLTEYATPVPLVLVSDAETEVTIVRIGILGTFDRREVMLRPGRYIITGSRDGCRDVRKEIILGPQTAPVEIRCQERI